jgi:hypothetical protein
VKARLDYGARRRGRFQPPAGTRWVVADLGGFCDVRAAITAPRSAPAPSTR